MDKTVVIFGAGATKACGGPLTNEILPDVFTSRANLARTDHVNLLEEFLVKTFHLPMTRRTAAHYPPLPLVLSLIDTALDRDDAFSAAWPPSRLREVRDALEYSIYALLEYRLKSVGPHYANFFVRLFSTHDPDAVTVISLNYDIIADNAMSALAERRGAVFPDYGCDIATEQYRRAPKLGTLLKPHGSLNWLYCPNCHRLDIGIAESGRRTVKVLQALYSPATSLDERYERVRGCKDCGTLQRPVLITPTHRKDYRNPHIARVWYEAGRALREATRAIFIGYSMPDDDVDVVYLFKRGLEKVERRAITVVEYAPGRVKSLDKHPVGLRYRALFGPQIDWRTDGFGAYVETA